jgi:hypothetical protein
VGAHSINLLLTSIFVEFPFCAGACAASLVVRILIAVLIATHLVCWSANDKAVLNAHHWSQRTNLWRERTNPKKGSVRLRDISLKVIWDQAKNKHLVPPPQSEEVELSSALLLRPWPSMAWAIFLCCRLQPGPREFERDDTRAAEGHRAYATASAAARSQGQVGCPKNNIT